MRDSWNDGIKKNNLLIIEVEMKDSSLERLLDPGRVLGQQQGMFIYPWWGVEGQQLIAKPVN
jgi:hypothetical protein